MTGQLHKTKQLVYVGVMGALLFMVQIVLAGLPNIELVSFLIIIYTLHSPRNTAWAIAVFVVLEGIYYGFGMWWLSYLYIWYILYGVILATKKYSGWIFCSVISGLFGLLFGTLGSVFPFITMGFYGGIAYIISGIPFDVAHAIGNFLACLVLFKPLDRTMSILNSKLNNM